MTYENSGEGLVQARSLLLICAISAVLLVVYWTPEWSGVLRPVEIFTTALHEIGHAGACIATGGSVTGLTIVSLEPGHAGLTFCRGSNLFIMYQGGYMGTTLFGCLLMRLGRKPARARLVLSGLAVLIGLSTLFFVTKTLFHHGHILETLGSAAAGAFIAAALFFCATRLSTALAHLVVLFLAIQTSLNSIWDIRVVFDLSLSAAQGSSDATLMQDLTGIPAAIWSLAWGATALLLIWTTIKLTYFCRPRAH